MKRLSLLLITLLFSLAIQAGSALNIYTWGDYIPPSVVKQFENETGIKVNIAEFDSNEMLYTKLKSTPGGYYDLIFPSSYMVERMAREGMLYPLNYDYLPNIKHINPEMLDKQYDPGNRYAIPYVWGTTGIVVNDKYHDPETINSWSDLWQPRFENKLLLLDDVSEVFAMALSKLGYPINPKNAEQIKAAFQTLKVLWSNIKVFKGDSAHLVYTSEDATIGMGWSGDIYQARRINPHVQFIYPKEHFPMWIDCMAISSNAHNIKNAHKFLNFVMRPEIAKRIAVDQGYSTPNKDALSMLPEKMRQSPIINPNQQTLKRATVLNFLPHNRHVINHYWERLKLGL
jgi:spermidine/putrescine transport system substrate-binding protein